VIESRKESKIEMLEGEREREREREGKGEKDRMQRTEASRLGKKTEAPSAARY